MALARIDSDDLLDAARDVFARQGFDRARMQDVADAAATTKPTLYARFGSKRALYERAVARDADALLAHLFEAYNSVADASVDEMVTASMEAWFDFFAERPEAYTLLFSSGRAEPATVVADQVLAAVTDRLTEMVENVLRREGPAGSRVSPPGRTPATEPRPLGERSPSRHGRLLAAMLVGIAHQGTAEARRNGADPADASRLAIAVALAALRGLPRDAL